MSFLLMRFRLLNDMVSPLAIALNAIPIVVLVSVFNNQFASTSEVPRRLMVTLIVYFVVLVNVAKGLRQVEATHLELLRSYAASPFDVIRKARVPNAVPYLFTALKIAAPLRRHHGLRRRVLRRAAERAGIADHVQRRDSRTPRLGVRVGRCLLGLVFYLVSIALESLINNTGAQAPGERTHEAQIQVAERRRHLRSRSSPPARTARAAARRATGTDRAPAGRPRRQAPTSASAQSVDDVTLQLQWVTRVSSPATWPPATQGFYENYCLNVEILEGGVDIVPQQVLADGDADFAIAWVPKALADAGGRRGHRQHRPDLPALGHAAGVASPPRASPARRTSRARTSATGASATSTRSSPRSARPASTRPPTSSSCSSTSTWSACSTAASTPPRR